MTNELNAVNLAARLALLQKVAEGLQDNEHQNSIWPTNPGFTGATGFTGVPANDALLSGINLPPFILAIAQFLSGEQGETNTAQPASTIAQTAALQQRSQSGNNASEANNNEDDGI